MGEETPTEDAGEVPVSFVRQPESAPTAPASAVGDSTGSEQAPIAPAGPRMMSGIDALAAVAFHPNEFGDTPPDAQPHPKLPDAPQAIAPKPTSSAKQATKEEIPKPMQVQVPSQVRPETSLVPKQMPSQGPSETPPAFANPLGNPPPSMPRPVVPLGGSRPGFLPGLPGVARTPLDPQRVVNVLKRPSGDMLAPANKKQRIDGPVAFLPIVPMQAKFKPSSPAKQGPPKAKQEVVPMEIEKEESPPRRGAFPGGRGVPSPTMGVLQRYKKSPLMDINFVARLGINRNPFRTSTHTPIGAYDMMEKAAPPVPPKTLSAAPISIRVGKSDGGGLFDSAAEIDNKIIEKQKKKTSKKKKPQFHHERVPLAKVNFTSPKDANSAKKLMAGIHDLSQVIPTEDAMWLGRSLWIFTVEQLDYSLSAPSKSDGDKPGADLAEAVALGCLVNKNGGSKLRAQSTSPKTKASNEKGALHDIKAKDSEETPGKPTPPSGETVQGGGEGNESTVVGKTPAPSNDSSDRAHDSAAAPQAPKTPPPKVTVSESGATPNEAPRNSGRVISEGSEEANLETQKPAAVHEISATPAPTNSVDTTAAPHDEGVVKSPSHSRQPGLADSNNSGEVGKEVPITTTSRSDVDHGDKNDDGATVQLQPSPPKTGDKDITEKVAGAADKPKQQKKPSQGPSTEQLNRAWEVLERWRSCITKFKAGQIVVDSPKIFLLSGPIGQLLPELVKQFLKTIRVTTVYDFFALKKTEASPLLGYYSDWRKHCELPLAKGYALARHLLGMNMRLEKAVRSMPPADQFARDWMSTVLCILTGSSKEFIIDDLNMIDVDYFLNERTKEWSDRLVLWRETNNLPVLKGSGKVAMVSGWKTSLKEALDVEKGKGRVLSEAELLKLPPGSKEDAAMQIIEIAPEKEKKKKKTPKKQPKPAPAPITYKSGQAALRSKTFFASALRPENIKFLSSAGIETAEQLIECDKQQSSTVVQELMKFRSKITGVDAQSATCVRLIYDWTQRVKAKLEAIESDTVKALAKKRGPRTTKDEADHVKSNGEAAKASKQSRPKGPGKPLKDPIEALSSNTRSFLASIDIYDGETFLRTKTSLISKTYIDWREVEKMSMLKGYGAIATVSGWKAQVRKSAADAGMHDLASTEPSDRGKQDPDGIDSGAGGKPVRAAKKMPSRLESVHIVQKTYSKLLFGLQARRLYVQGPTGVTFGFELSVRKSETASGEVAPFLTYLGQHNEGGLSEAQSMNQPVFDPDRIPLLVDVTADWESSAEDFDRSTFSSVGEGCGVIDLRKFGALQLPRGHLGTIKQDLMSFLESKPDRSKIDVEVPATGQKDRGGCANVFKVHTPLLTRHVFYHSARLEKGQTVELRFSSRSITQNELPIQEAPGLALRSNILSDISNLSVPDIKSTLQWLAEQSKPPFAISIGKHTDATTLQRRFHWIATTLLDRLDDIERKRLEVNKTPLPERVAAIKLSDCLLMKNAHFQNIRGAEDPTNVPSFATLVSEVVEEIKASMILNSSGLPHSNPSTFCKFALQLRDRCLDAASNYVILRVPESLQLQEAFLAEICKLAADTAHALVNDEVELAMLTLQVPNEEGEPEAVLATGSDWHEPVFRPLVDVTSGDAEVNRNWYLQHQLLAVVHSVATCNQIKWLHIPDPMYTYAVLTKKVDKALAGSPCDKIPQVKSPPPDWSSANLFMEKPSFDGEIPVRPTPNSLPLFLGLVWPKLRARYGWHIDAGPSKSDVVFLPPGQKNRAKRRHDRSAKVKQERQQKRAKLDKKLQEVGFGYVPKLTKRLMNQSGSSDSGASKATISVRKVLDNFAEHVLAKTANPESEVNKRRVTSIVDGFGKLFGSLLPVIDPSVVDEDDSDVMAKTYGCEHLIQILIVLPNILQRSGLPIRQIEDSTYMIKDLVRYLTDYHKECFDPDLRPDEEEYDGSELVANEFLPAKLDLVLSRDGNAGEASGDVTHEDDDTMVRDLIQPADLADLTDFTAMAMRQMVPCRATMTDTTKKGRKYVPVGYPGMVCKYCWGTSEGKYFFTSPDSLGTAGGVIYGHLTKCPKFPADLLKKLATFKSQQAEARKKLKHGAQAAYFNRLWKRLHSAKTIGTAGVLVRQASVQLDEADLQEEQQVYDSGGKKELEFKSHIDLVEYIQKTSPWNKEADLIEAVRLYYHGLYQGARIFNTNAAPSHFSAEWLLAKVSPVSLHGKNRHAATPVG